MPKILNSNIIAIDLFDGLSVNKQRLVLVYRPTTNESLEHFTCMIDTLTDLCTIDFPVTILGDFNFPNLTWNADTIRNTSSNKEQLFSHFMCTFDLIQHVNFPTRSDNTLDLILSNACVNDITCLPPFGSQQHQSDHNCISFSLTHTLPTDTSSSTNTYNFKRGNYELLNSLLLSIDWNALFANSTDIDSLYATFSDTITSIIETHIPKNMPKSPLLSYPQHIQNLIVYRNKLWPHIKYPSVREKFEKCSQQIDSKINKFLANREKLHLKTPKSRFGYVGSFLKTKHCPIPTLKTTNGQIIISKSEKAKYVAEFFQSVFTNSTLVVPSSPIRASFCASTIEHVDIDSEIIYREICASKLKTNISSDKIPIYFLKKCAVSLTYPLWYIYNFATMSGTLPSIWKQSIVIPIPKTPNASEIEKLRPISLLCPSSKIFEKIIHRSLSRHLESNGVIPSCQHGFRNSHSVTTQLISVVDDISQALENSHCIDIIYFDYQKAFDTISHEMLLSKLLKFGIKGSLYKLIENYLSNRQFTVKIDNCFSDPKNVTSGVPQGSILGPLLFITYISDLPEFCKTENVNIKLYADDLKAYHTFSPIANSHLPLQNFITKLSKYSELNGLKISVKKCYTLHIGPKNPNHLYTLNDSQIPNIPKGESARDLGVHFTSDLKWSNHIEIIVKKSKKVSWALLRSIKSNNSQFLIEMFKVYVLPILEFACPIFHPYHIKDIKSIEKVQRDFVRQVYKRCCKNTIQNSITYVDLLATFELELLEIRRLKICLNLFHQYIHGNVPLRHDKAFECRPSKTRGDPYKIVTNTVQHPARFNSFFVRISTIYSKLDSNTRKSTVIEFPKRLNCIDLSAFIQTNYITELKL